MQLQRKKIFIINGFEKKVGNVVRQTQRDDFSASLYKIISVNRVQIEILSLLENYGVNLSLNTTFFDFTTTAKF